MIDPKHIELMNLTLDGVASDAQRQQLQKYLSMDGTAAAYFEELSRVVRNLDARPLVEPPPELHPRIIDSLEHAAGHATRRPARHARSGHGGWIERIFAPPRRRTVSVFGLGLVTGVSLFVLLQLGRPGGWDAPAGYDPDQLTGTMSRPAGAAGEASIALDPATDGVGGSVELFTEQGVTVIDARIETPIPVEWSLGFDPGLRVTRFEAPSGSALEFGASAGEVHGRFAGTGTCRVVLSGQAHPVESVVLKVLRDGQVVVERPASPRSR